MEYIPKREKILYDLEYKSCGSHITIKKYSAPIMRGYEQFRKDYSKSKEGEKSDKSLYRTRSNLVDIINTNFTPYMKFITFTFKKAVLDRKEALQYWHKFRIQFKKIFHKNYSYVMVMERQKLRGIKECNKGSWHFHSVVFIQEKLEFEKLKRSWLYGSVEVHLCDDAYNVARYIAKYITKDTLESNLNEKLIFTSHDLKKPSIMHCSAENEAIKEFEFMNKEKKCYEADYSICTNEIIQVKQIEYNLKK